MMKVLGEMRKDLGYESSRVGAEELFATFDSDSVDEWLIKLNLQHLFAELGGKPPQI